MKILLLGKSGLLGSEFVSALADFDGDVLAPSRAELDIEDFEEVRAFLERERPDFVINCTGYTAVDDAETAREAAERLNHLAVKNLAFCCRDVGAALVHFSTDYVFDGESQEVWAEDDATGPVNVYGETKLAGEKAVEDCGGKWFVVRTSWLFGSGGKNFVSTMLGLGREREEISVVNDQFGSPTFTGDLVEAVLNGLVFVDAASGIYHLTNAGVCSWYDFACEIFKVAGMPVRVLPVSSEEFKRPAKRPKFSALKNTKLAALRRWEEGVREEVRGKK